MNEMKRAEEIADTIIEKFAEERSANYKVFTYNYELACEEELFQELVIQQIRNRGYLVKRRYDEAASTSSCNLTIALNHFWHV